MRANEVGGLGIALVLLGLAACRGQPAAAADGREVLGPARLGMPEAELRTRLRRGGVYVRCAGTGGTVRCAWRRPDAMLGLEYWAHDGRVIALTRTVRRPGVSADSIYARELQRLGRSSDEDFLVDDPAGGLRVREEGLEWIDVGTLMRSLVCVTDLHGVTECRESLASWVHDDGGATALPAPLPDSVAPVDCASWPRRLLGAC